MGGVEIEDVIRAVAAVLLSGRGQNTSVIWIGRKSWEGLFLAVRSPIARFAMNGEERVGESPDCFGERNGGGVRIGLMEAEAEIGVGDSTLTLNDLSFAILEEEKPEVLHTGKCPSLSNILGIRNVAKFCDQIYQFIHQSTSEFMQRVVTYRCRGVA